MGKQIIRSMTLDEISAVDEPAQKPARKAIIKSRGGEVIVKTVKMTTAVDGHQHIVDQHDWEGNYLDGGQTSWVSGSPGEEHSHPWTRDENGRVVIGESLGHMHDIEEISKSTQQTPNGETAMASKIKKSLLASAALTLAAITKFDTESSWGDAEAIDIVKAAQTHDVVGALTGDLAKTLEKMNDEEEEDENKKKMADLEKSVATLTAVNSLNAINKAHYDSLPDDDAKAAFLKADEDKRASLISKAKDGDPVVYTAINGDEFRKSDDPRMVKMARDRDNEREELAKAKVAALDARIEKRSAEFDKLPGSEDVRKGIMRAFEGIEDEDIRKGAYAALKAGNDALGGDFAPSGAISKSDAKGYEDQLNDLAKNHAKAEGVSFEKAYVAVTQSGPGRDLYNKVRMAE